MNRGRSGHGRRGSPELASRLVRRFVRGLEVGPALQVLGAWPRVAGALVAQHLQAVRFVDGTLFVRAEQSVWSHQLTFMRPDLLRNYAEVLGKPTVRDIRLTMAAPAAPGQAAAPPPAGYIRGYVPGAGPSARTGAGAGPSAGTGAGPDAGPGAGTGAGGGGAVAGRPGEYNGPVRFAQLPQDEVAAIEARAAEHIKDPELAKRWAKLEERIKSAQLARKLAGEKACEKCGVRHPGKGRLCPICDIEGKPPISPGAQLLK